MSHLLDVNVLLAAIWTNHPQHAQANAWIRGKELTVCPLSELGFVRISSNPKGINASMGDARTALDNFLIKYQVAWIPDNLRALESKPDKSDQVTDHYLADLADKHGVKLATFDAGIKHPAVQLIT